jgi:hypothetical protein
MAHPNLLICIGATKTGTSWLYRYLHDHQECHVRMVKECHYFSTFDTRRLKSQLMAFPASIRDCDSQLVEAEAADEVSKILALGSKIDDISALMAVLSGNRTADSAYFDYLLAGRADETALLAVTPGYSLLETPQIERMAQLPICVKILYRMRDSSERLWSQIRMYAKRTLSGGQEFATLCLGLHERTLFDKAEAFIVTRGDYKANIELFDTAFDWTDFHSELMENLTDWPRFTAMWRFLCSTATSPTKVNLAHVGRPAPFTEVVRVGALKFLDKKYDFVAKHFGILPQTWQQNREILA